MELMSLSLGWPEILTRLALATLGGALFGLNRVEFGKVAGLRTSMLVCLAACISMLQVNALLAQSGKQTESFAVLDLMRLPLGVLTGVGFIGAGTILRKDGLVKGVTTAASLWFLTVIGLCFGGGQLSIGIVSMLLGLIVVWLLRYVEDTLPRRNSVVLSLAYSGQSFSKASFLRRLSDAKCQATPISSDLDVATQTIEEKMEIAWQARDEFKSVPPFIEMAVAEGAMHAAWSVQRP